MGIQFQMSQNEEKLIPMLSFELWRTLHETPTQYPLRLMTHERPAEEVSLLRRLLADYLPFAIVALIFISAWLLGIMIIIGLGLLLAFGGGFYGLVTVYAVSQAVTRHRARGYYELMLMTPPGVLGIQWAISAYALQRSELLVLMRGLMHRLYIGVFMLIGLVFIFSMVAMSQPLTKYAPNVFAESVAPELVSAFCLALVHYLDFTRSGLVGALFGMLIPTFTEGRRETVYIAIALYVLLQILFYMACWIIGFETLRNLLTLAGMPSNTLHNLVRLILMILIREIILFGLWRWLLWRLNVQPAESRAELVLQRPGNLKR
jgi:hypothetical protein